MRTSGKYERNILNITILLALLFLFGSPARANVTASPNTISFGNHAVGTTSSPITVTVTNTSRRNTTISSVSMSQSQFSYSGPSLPVTLKPEQSLTASVTFTPATAITYSGSLTFAHSGGGATSVSLAGTGTAGSSTAPATSYIIYATPSSLSFTLQAGVAATTQNVLVNDTTPGPLPFTLSADQPWITLSATTGNTKGGGETMQFGVNPAGLAAGSYSGHVYLTASGVSNSPQAVPITLTVSPNAAVAPAITTQPSSMAITAGKTATFNVAATGTSPMTYQWKKNGAAISSATSSTYTTPAETTSDNNAQFTVAVSNSAGSATSNAAVLTVNAAAAVAPTITSQPSSQTVIAGQTATFSVAATGTAPFTYQWQMNGTAISGATSSSYTTPAETTSNTNAKFTVTVTNSASSATSNSATLTVNAATFILNASSTALNFGNVNMSGSSSQNVTLTNAGNSTVSISGVSISGAGFNASGVSTGLNLNPGQAATLTATFTPSAAGSMTGSVAVSSNAMNSPDTISLSGTGVSVVNHSAALSWTASTSSVMGYNTYSSTVSGGPYTKLTVVPSSATAYTDTTVQAGQTYYYVVTAVNSANVESAYSGQVAALIP